MRQKHLYCSPAVKWLNTARFSEIKIDVFPVRFDNNIKSKAESRTMFLCFLKLQYYKSILSDHVFVRVMYVTKIMKYWW